MPYGRRGGEFAVNKQLVGHQYAPSIAGFDSGGFIVVWWSTDTLQDGAGFAIKAQRYDSLGNAIGAETLVNSSAAGDQRAPSVTTLSSGGYVVTWETTDTTQDGSGRAIKGQLFDASGAAVGSEFRVNTGSSLDQTNSSVTGLAGGGFVVTWETADPTADGHSSAIKGQIYNAAGVAVGGEFLVNTGAFGNEANPDVTSLSGGGFIATWTRGSGTSADIYAQVFDANGAKAGGQFLVNSTTTYNQSFPSVSEISGGRFVVTWQSSASLTTMDTEIRARIFSADGTPLGTDFVVNTSRTHPDSGFLLGASAPSVADLPGGGFVITWSPSSGSAPGSSVYAQVFDANGNRVGTEVLVNTVTNRFESDAEVAVDGNGNLFVLWGSYNQTFQDSDIRGQIYVASGAPEIVSNGGGDIASVTAAENQNAVTTVSAVDPDASGSLVYSIVAGADASRFAINATTGALTFVSSPNFEARVDSNGNGIYEVVVSVSDGVMTDIQALFVTVTNVNEAPTISSSNPSNYFHIENRTAVATFSATDPDGTAVTWSIAGGADAARFAIDPATGALRFVTAPDFEAPADAGADNFYNVTIAASDGSLVATRALTIEIANWNEGPVILSGGGGSSAAVSVAENTSLVTTVVADDPDASNSPFTFAIAGGADAALFTIHAQTGQLFFKSNFGANFEAPADAGGNNVYDVIVSVSDGWEPADTQAIAVTVTDANDAPVITSNGGGASASLSLPENQRAVTTVAATDADNGTLTYAIAGGADAALFAIEAQTGLLTFISTPDREAPHDAGANNVYNVTVSVSDGDKTDTQALAVSILNVNEAPVITSNGGGSSAGLTIDEGTNHVTTVVAYDPEGTPVYSITGGADASRFTIDSATGVLSFVDAPDYEAPLGAGSDNFYDVIVTASDGQLSSSQTLSVMVRNVNEAVTITSGGGADSVAVTVAEDQPVVAGVTAVDADGTPVLYSIAGGADAALFAIDPVSGELRIAEDVDYELPGDADGDNVYEVIVAADDGWLSDTQAYSVAIADVDEPLSFTSYNSDFYVSLIAGENGLDAAAVAAEDPEGAAIVYSIVDSYDGASFTIDSETGVIRFATAPDRESPADLDGDNVYTVLVAATDGNFFDYQTISIEVGDVNEGPIIASPAAATVAENGTAVSTVVASDPEGDSVSYAIAGGADALRFTIDAQTGALSFVQAPDFEAPADSDGDNVYELIVSATDGVLTASQAVAVTVSNAAESVAITSNGGGAGAQIWMPENGTAVTVVAASDPDGGPVTYAITGGADADRFTIDSSTGALAFVAAPDFESTRGAGGSNDFYVTVSASDGSSTDSQSLTVILSNVVEGVHITSHGGAESVSVTLTEGWFTTYDVDAWHDVEVFAPIVYSLSGADAAFFTIDNQGRFSFDYDAPPDFEGPADADGDNVYDVTVTASIGTYSDSQAFAITIVNRDENVVFTSGGGEPFASFTVAENGTVVTTISAVDPEGGAVTYAISGGFDAARFTIDPNTGILSFVAAPDFEDPTDAGWYGPYAERDGVYNVSVTATDGTFIATQFIDVTVTDIDEPVEILSYGGASAVALTMTEGTGLTVATVEADDEEDWIVTYAITGGADAALFQINAYTGVLTFNYGVYPDFEAPADAGGDNVYDVVVTASSSTSSADQAFAIAIADRNEGLRITSNDGGDANLTMNEGDRAVTTVTAEDQDGDVPTYSIVGGADAALFAIDPVTGVLTFIAAPDYEAPNSGSGTNVYLVEVGASDGEFLGTQRIRIEIGDVNETPVITFGGGGETAAVTVNENGLAVTSIAASDVDGNPLTWSITGGADASLFTIESWSGALRFIQGPNFEAPGDADGNNVYDVVVSVTDGALTDSQALAVTVANLAEIVTITSNGGGASGSVTVSENGTAVATVAASSPDGGTVTYAIAGGADSARFTINASTGVLAFLAAPNFEAPADAGANNVYDVVVSASNGATTDTQALAVTVGNVNEQMVIASNGGGASASVSVDENSTAVTTVVGVDPDGGPVTYVILHGGDSGLFTINSTTGVLSFRAAPNFESPGDAGGDNVYNVVVMASDGHWADDQAIAVTVRNVAEAPLITSSGGGSAASVSVNENGRFVTTVVGGDPDGAAIVYSIVGGADAARFTIDPQTGALQFVAAPDFELPGDANGDNIYNVVVQAGDGQLADTQNLSVTVGNVRDGSTVTGTSGADTISGTVTNPALRTTAAEDTVYGRDGNDTISGLAGADWLFGEGGNDTIIGGAGADRLTGGLGKDQFVYNGVSDSTPGARDVITDFSRSQGDKINLSAIDANANLVNNQSFIFIGAAAFSNVAGQLRFETSNGVTLVSGDVNGDGLADFQIELTGTLTPVASDFLL